MDDKREICCSWTKKIIRRGKDLERCYRTIYQRRPKLRDFLGQETEPKIIARENLADYDTAFFELNTDLPDWDIRSIENVMVDYKVDTDKGIVTTENFLHCMGDYKLILITRKYDLANYQKTWRAWTAMPAKRSDDWAW